MEEKNVYTSAKGAADILKLNEQTLANWRHLRKGPAYSKLGRAIRYRISDLISYAESKKIEVKD